MWSIIVKDANKIGFYDFFLHFRNNKTSNIFSYSAFV